MVSAVNMLIVLIIILLGRCSDSIRCCTAFHNQVRSGGHKSNACSAFPGHSRVTPSFSSATDGIEEKAALVKLPILQIIRSNELCGEFICGNDLPLAVDKFAATLSSLEKKTSLDASVKPGNYGMRNIYSDDQLLETLESATNDVILKIFREGCKKCALLEPIIDDLSRDPLYSKFVFLQADVSNIEVYTKNLKERLLGSGVGNGGNCATCLDSGFVSCEACNGLGYVQKGTLAAFCPSCTGYKKVRCSTCGGHCPKCS